MRLFYIKRDDFSIARIDDAYKATLFVLGIPLISRIQKPLESPRERERERVKTPL